MYAQTLPAEQWVEKYIGTDISHIIAFADDLENVDFQEQYIIQLVTWHHQNIEGQNDAKRYYPAWQDLFEYLDGLACRDCGQLIECHYNCQTNWI